MFSQVETLEQAQDTLERLHLLARFECLGVPKNRWMDRYQTGTQYHQISKEKVYVWSRKGWILAALTYCDCVVLPVMFHVNGLVMFSL